MPVDELRISMPVSTRTDGSAGGNAFTPTRVLLPVGIVELVLVLIPVSYLISPLVFMGGGTHQINFWTINSIF